MSATPVVQRIVPGAPPSIELSKSQKKKRKAAKGDDIQSPVGPESAHSSDKAHEHAELNESAPGLVSRSESQAPQLESPIVDLMNRRLKAMTKKIARVSTYAATDIEKLNDDQVRSLKNLPTLEAIQKEVGEVKKAIETHEQELAQDLAGKRLEAERAEKARISNAVSDAEASLFIRFTDVLDVLRVHSLLSSGVIDLASLADASEISALFSISNILLGESDRNQSIVEQIVRGVGDFEGTSYTRILAITQQALNPPRSPSPVPEESVDEEPPAPPSVDEADEDQAPVTGIPVSNSMTGSFQFIQQSELEAASFEGASEWVDATVHEPEAEGASVDAEPAPATSVAPDIGNGTLDWAADEEGGLPSIAGLQAEFGNSGSVTPAEAEKATHVEGAAPETSWQTYGETNANGDAAAVEVDDEGFTQAKARARARGGFRGDRGERGHRGGRGGERGSHRGGDRGFRGGRGERGGYRGGRGGSDWHGDGDRAREGHGDWGGDRDRGSGDGERVDGERHRGRGGGGGGGFGRGRGEGGRGRGGEGRGRGRRGGRGDRGGHHHETAPTPA